MNPQTTFADNFAWLLWRAAARHSGRPLLVSGTESVSFMQLRDRAASVAAGLVARGVAPGDRVAIFLPRGADAAAAFFGGLAAGAVVVVVNELSRVRQLEYVLGHAGARVLVTSRGMLAALGESLVTTAQQLDPADLPAVEPTDPLPIGGAAPAQLVYTSGSTGRPKGVLTSHANLWWGEEVVREYLDLTSDDRIAGLLPFSFVYGMSQLTLAVGAGATLVLLAATLGQDLVDGLAEHKVTVVAAVPPLWAQLLRVARFRETPLPDLRICTCAGGRLPPEQVRLLRQGQPQARLFLMYGMTEVFRSTYLPPEEVDAHPDSMGRAVPHSEVYVLDEDGRPCADGEVGELVHKGPTVALGYWQDPEATARIFRPDPLAPVGTPPATVVHSGDLVRRDAEGRLYYVARRDRLIKSLGYRISPDEVSDVLLASGQVAEAVVVGAEDAQRGQAIVAHLVLKPDGTLDEVRRFAGRDLPRYMQPARYQVHAELPRNPAGKVDVLALDRTVTVT